MDFINIFDSWFFFKSAPFTKNIVTKCPTVYQRGWWYIADVYGKEYNILYYPYSKIAKTKSHLGYMTSKCVS